MGVTNFSSVVMTTHCKTGGQWWGQTFNLPYADKSLGYVDRIKELQVGRGEFLRNRYRALFTSGCNIFHALGLPSISLPSDRQESQFLRFITAEQGSKISTLEAGSCIEEDAAAVGGGGASRGINTIN